MSKLNPVEYHYLSFPLFSTGQELMKLTLQYLCLIKVINIEQKWITINKREKRKRQRFFFSQGIMFETYKPNNEAEKFVLDLFHTYPEFRFYVLRHYIKKQFGKRGIYAFKTDFVCKDAKKKQQIYLGFIISSTTRKEMKNIKLNLMFINKHIDDLINNNPKKLSILLQELDGNILHLKPETINKIKTVSDDIQKIKDLGFLAILNANFSTMDTFFSSGLGGFDSIGFSGFDGFSGFSGGDFGGGGAGGDW